MPEPKATSRPAARIAAIVLVAAALGFLLLAQSSSPPATTEAPPAPAPAPTPTEIGPQPAPPSRELLSLLDGLSQGQEINGWKVVNFFPPQNRTIWIEFQQGERYFSVGIGPRGAGQPPPPVQTESYEVGFGMMHPPGVSIPQSEMTPVVQEVANRIRARERGSPRVPGL